MKAYRTHEEVAAILTARGEPITRGGVFMAEKTALEKLRAALMPLARDMGIVPADEPIEMPRQRGSRAGRTGWKYPPVRPEPRKVPHGMTRRWLLSLPIGRCGAKWGHQVERAATNIFRIGDREYGLADAADELSINALLEAAG
jgi:hypothetical protein